MDLSTWLLYVYIRLRLWLFNKNKKTQSRLNVCCHDVKNTAPESNGMLPSIGEWNLATPNSKCDENITLAGSNTWHSGLQLHMKWRPNESMKLSTLLTQFTLELDEIYDYEEVWTQSYDFQSQQPIRKYAGQNIRLEVILPYRSYRIIFSGYMRRRSTSQLVFVRFRSIISNAGKIYDFKESYDSKFMANQLAQKSHPMSYDKTLHELVLQDRHEHAVQFRSSYTVGESLEEKKLFCWGFHCRQFLAKSNKNLRSKQILGYFANGTSFHVGVIESTDGEQFVGATSKQRQFNFGYCCPRYQITHPIQELNDDINWDQISADTRQIPTINLKSDGIDFSVKSCEESSSTDERQSNFIDIVANDYKGRGFILVNDCMESSTTGRLIEGSVQEYLGQIANKSMVDLVSLDIEYKTTKLSDGSLHKPMVTSFNGDGLYSSLGGAKAASLAQLKRLVKYPDPSFDVPLGIVVTRYAYDAILELNPELRLEEKRLASVVCQGDREKIKYESERFCQKFFSPRLHSNLEEENYSMTKKLQFPPKLLKELENACFLKQEGVKFAVRSSSWGEDEANMSAAGQLTTLLNVEAGDDDKLHDALLVCFGSKYSLTNLEYKRQHGMPIDMPMAIVVQEMVECDRAGVMFTCDPTNGDESQLLITANYGLGESVVSAAADPDTIKVEVIIDLAEPNNLSKRQVGPIKQVTIGQKKVIIKSTTNDDDDGKENNQAAGEMQHDTSKCCLTDDEIVRLAECGLKLAAYFRSGRDIEWGLKDGKLYLFQARPITGLEIMNDFELLHEASRGLSAEKEWLTRANIGEVLPYAITPLTCSYVLNSWTVFANYIFMAMKFLTSDRSYPQQTPEFTIFNCFYFVVLRVSRTFCFGSGENRPLQARAMEMGFFGHEVDEPELAREASKLSDTMPSLTAIMYFLISGLPYRLFPKLMYLKARKRVINLRRDILKHKFVKTSSMSDLFKQMHIVVMKGCESWKAHIMLIIISPAYNQTLTTILSKYIDEPAKIFATYSKLLSSCKDVFSAGVPRQIEQMAKIIMGNENGNDEKSLQGFLAMNDTETLRYITSEPNSDLTKLFNKFMDQFGHRSYNEFELSSRPWRDEPVFVINMIKKACQDQLNKIIQKRAGGTTFKEDSGITETTTTKRGSLILREMGIELSLFDRLYVDYYILPKCHQYMKVRELTKDLLIFNTDCLRDAVRMLAKELRQNCRIPDDDLINYLSYEELGRVVHQHEPGLVDQAQRRRRFYKKLNNWTFDEIISGYEFLPRHLIVDSAEVQREKEEMKLLKKIYGTPACSGKIRGPVCIVDNYEHLSKVKPGDILITYSTDIAFSPIFPIIGGIITEIGGLISHGAVIAREYGLPSLIGVQNATTIFKQGEIVELDATNGFVLRLEQ